MAVRSSSPGASQPAWPVLYFALARYLSNNQPTAHAGPDQTVLAGQSVQLDGTGSTDPDEDPLAFNWILTGPGAPVLDDDTAAMPAFCATEPGTNTAALTVNDGAVDSTPDEATIIALTPTDALDEAITAVDDLLDNGTLNNGQANALNRKLAQTQKLLAKGQPDEALMVLADYQRQLADLHDQGVLSSDQQQELAAAATEITGVLEAPCGCAAKAGTALVHGPEETPWAYALGSYPNPFNPVSTVAFALQEGCRCAWPFTTCWDAKQSALSKARWRQERTKYAWMRANCPRGRTWCASKRGHRYAPTVWFC